MKTIGICSDHAGFELKEYVRGWLEAKGWAYKDFGTYSTESCDYPDFAHPLALAVEAGECYPGIAICGSGEGISITLNKHQGIRAALCWTAEIAHLARQHNDANVLVSARAIHQYRRSRHDYEGILQYTIRRRTPPTKSGQDTGTLVKQ